MDPSDPSWLANQLGAAGLFNPRASNDRTQVKANLATTPVVSAAGIEGADRWLVEIRNHETGQADYGGEMPLTSTPGQVIRRFLNSMPNKAGDPPAELYFKALDKTGAKLGTATKPDGTFSVPWHSPVLADIRELVARQTPPPATSGANEQIVAILKEMAAQAREDAKLAEERRLQAEKEAREAERLALKQRLDHASALNSDVGAMYSAVNKTQETGFTALMSAQERAAAEREKREEERLRREHEAEERRRQRERDQNEEERKRREEERREERDRLRAENQAALDRVRAEADARVKEMELRARLEEAKISAEVEKAKAHALAETERLRLERERDDARRKEERDRQDRLDTAERERAREHQRDMEKIRTDAMDAAQKRLEAEAKRGEEHTRLVISLLEKHQGGGHKLGPLGEILDMVGLTIPELIEKGKNLLGGEATKSVAVAVVESLGGIAQEVIKRLPQPQEEFEDDEVDEEDVEEDVEPPTVRRRRTPKKEPRQIEASDETQTSGTVSVMERALAGVAEAQQAQAEPDSVIPLDERRAGRLAVSALVDRLDGVERAQWPAAVMDGRDLDVLVRYVGIVGLRRALADHDINAEEVGKVLVELGLFPSPPMDPTKEENK